MSRAALFHRKDLDMCSIELSIDNPTSKSKPAHEPLPLWLLPILAAVLALSGCESMSTANVKNTLRTFRTVVIDPGHGGHDLGTSSRWGGAEKNATLETALKLQPKLEAAGFRTVMTRRSDTFIELNQRAYISNAQTNAIFVSIHFNEAPVRAIHGTETYYMSPVAHPLAVAIQRAVTSLPGSESRGVKIAHFRVLRLNEYPAVLVECGFLSNPAEGRRCATSAYREQLASAIANAIIGLRGPLSAEPVAKAD